MNIPPRRKQTRLTGFDYSSEGAYFVTLVTHGRECLFGEIINDEMVLSEFGRIVVEEWKKSALIRAEIKLGAYVAMPNHFHGIVHIFQNKIEPENRCGGVWPYAPTRKQINKFQK